MFRVILILFPLLLLANCDPATKRSLGIDKKAPDESVIRKKPPLYVPPKFNLVPPEEENSQAVAKNNKTPAKLSAAEQSFINKISPPDNN